MIVDSELLGLVTAFASFFLQIIFLVQRLMTESIESLLLILVTVLSTLRV